MRKAFFFFFLFFRLNLKGFLNVIARLCPRNLESCYDLFVNHHPSQIIQRQKKPRHNASETLSDQETSQSFVNFNQTIRQPKKYALGRREGRGHLFLSVQCNPQELPVRLWEASACISQGELLTDVVSVLGGSTHTVNETLALFIF